MWKIALLTLSLMSMPAAHSDDSQPTNVYQHIKSEHWEFTPKTHRQIQAEKAAQQRQEEAWAREAQRQAEAQAQARERAQMQYQTQSGVDGNSLPTGVSPSYFGTNGQHYQGVAGGIVNSTNGTFSQDVGAGFVNSQTGQFTPKP